MTTNKDSLREAIKQIFVKNNMADEDDPMTEFNDVEYFDLEQVIDDLGDYFTSHIEEAVEAERLSILFYSTDTPAHETIKEYIKDKVEQLKQTKGVE